MSHGGEAINKGGEMLGKRVYFYLRSTVEESKQHKPFVSLRKWRSDNAKTIHERNDDQYLLTAHRISNATPKVGTDHHTNEDDRIQPAFGLGIQIQIALRWRQDERHTDNVHLFARADQTTDGQQNVMEFAIAAQLNGLFEAGLHAAGRTAAIGFF